MNTVHKASLELDQKMTRVVELEEIIKTKERRVLDKEIEILEVQQQILKKLDELSEK